MVYPMNNLHIKIPLMLGLVGIGLLATHAPAHAVSQLYVFNNTTVINGATVSGSFRFDPDPLLSGTAKYSDLSITLSGGGTAIPLPFTYTTANLINSFTSTSAPFGLTFSNTTGDSGIVLRANGSAASGKDTVLSLLFNTSLTGTLGQFSVISTNTNPGSFQVVANTGTNDLDAVGSASSGGGVTAVPLETDALPVAVSTVLVGGAFWLRRRKRSQITLDISPAPQLEKVEL
jgi:hypothetical protein